MIFFFRGRYVRDNCYIYVVACVFKNENGLAEKRSGAHSEWLIERIYEA